MLNTTLISRLFFVEKAKRQSLALGFCCVSLMIFALMLATTASPSQAVDFSLSSKSSKPSKISSNSKASSKRIPTNSPRHSPARENLSTPGWFYPVNDFVWKSYIQRTLQKPALRSRVFAKAGDSNTEMSFAFYGISCFSPVALPSGLKQIAKRYSAVSFPESYAHPQCEGKSTSFSRHSAAARGGMEATWALSSIASLPDNGWGSRDSKCFLRETPISCELRLLRPRYMFLMTGSNDPTWQLPLASAKQRLRAVIKRIRFFRTIPVLSTIPPNIGEGEDISTGLSLPDWVQAYNRKVKEVAREERVPLIDLWSVLAQPGIVNHGVKADGVHLAPFLVDNSSTAHDMENSVVFTREALRYGANRRNFVMLRALNLLDRQTKHLRRKNR